MSRSVWKWAFGALALAGCGQLDLGAPVAESHAARSFAASGHVTIVSDTGAGTLNISPSTDGRVHVKATVHVFGFGDDAQSRADDLAAHPPFSASEGTIRLSQPDDGTANVDWDLLVPSDAEVRATSGSGDLGVHGVAGTVHAQSSSGEVDVSHAGGTVDVTTASGRVTVDGAPSASVHTASGDVQVNAVPGPLVVGTISGDAAVQSAGGALDVNTTSGKVTLESRIPDGAEWNVATLSGDVRVLVDSRDSLTIQVDTMSGDFQSTVDVDTQNLGEHEVEASIGAHPTAALHVQTASGDVSLNALPAGGTDNP